MKIRRFLVFSANRLSFLRPQKCRRSGESRNPASGEAAPLSPAAKVSAWRKTLDSGFRRNDGGGSRLERLAGCGGISATAKRRRFRRPLAFAASRINPRPSAVIPAKAGIQNDGFALRFCQFAAVNALDSRLRGNDGQGGNDGGRRE
ncbi:MAG: hypothetical protein ACR2P5_07630 [Gammaproteobacteria bacterium]